MTTSNVLDEVAAVAAVVRTAGDPMDWMRSRWAELDRTSPQSVYQHGLLHRAGDKEVRAVEAGLITYVCGGSWGEIDYRPSSYDRIMAGLVEVSDRQSADRWVRTMGKPQLVEVPGPYGPLFEVGGDGRHRTYILKGLNLTWSYLVTPSAGIVASARLPEYPYTPNLPRPDRGPRQAQAAAHRKAWYAQNLARKEARELLVEVGFLSRVTRRGWTPEYEVVPASLPFPWAICSPATVAAFSTRYQQSYPRFGAVEAERAALSRSTWTQYLQERRCPRYSVE
jgi:hypothetical protein